MKKKINVFNALTDLIIFMIRKDVFKDKFLHLIHKLHKNGMTQLKQLVTFQSVHQQQILLYLYSYNLMEKFLKLY